MATDDRVDELFAGPPEEFTARRDELVKALRAEGHKQEAAGVAGLRRPTRAAWAVNQLARRCRDELEELIAAGGEVRQAQRRAASGVGDERLREGLSRRRERLDALQREARRLLDDAGVDRERHMPEVVATLQAASADDDAAQEVKAGQLSRPLPAPSGFGDLAGLQLVADQGPAAQGFSAEEADEAASEEAKRARQAAQEARRRWDEATQQAHDERQRAEQLRQQATEARQRAEELQRKAQQAAQQAEEAESAAAGAEADAEEASAASERRRRELAKAEEAAKTHNL